IYLVTCSLHDALPILSLWCRADFDVQSWKLAKRESTDKSIPTAEPVMRCSAVTFVFSGISLIIFVCSTTAVTKGPFYNTKRIYSTLGYKTPKQIEEMLLKKRKWQQKKVSYF